MKKYSFLKTLISVCSSRDLFSEIVKFPLSRTFYHLFLVGLICSIAFSIMSFPNVENGIDKASNYLQKEFGKIVVKEDGVYPQKNPDEPRVFTYEGTQVNYYPSLPKKNELNIDHKLNNKGLIWSPSGVTGWIKINDNQFVTYQALVPGNKPKWFDLKSEKGLYSYVYNNTLTNLKNLSLCICMPLKGNVPAVLFFAPLDKTKNFSDFSNYAVYYSLTITFVRFLFIIIFNALFYSLLFALIYNFAGKNELYNLNFKSFLNLAIYAGFPAIIIATLFTAAGLPYLRYQTIYLIALFVYLISITQKFRQSQSE